MLDRILRTHELRAAVLVRALVGAIFVSEGAQKFLYPEELGAGRFARIGFDAPELLGPLVGGVEVLCGALVLCGLMTRVAAAPLVGVMIGALVSIKVPIALGEATLGFALRPLPRYGVLSALHEARTDLSMLCCAAFLIAAGAGPWSVDAAWARRRARGRAAARRNTLR